MNLIKNTKVGIVSFLKFVIIFVTILPTLNAAEESNFLEGNFVEIKILDKVSSKNELLKIQVGKNVAYKDISIKVLKCKNSEFDDNPEVTAYIQVKDLSNKSNDEVFVFNGWTFSSSPTINPFDHPVYDIWLTKCY